MGDLKELTDRELGHLEEVVAGLKFDLVDAYASRDKARVKVDSLEDLLGQWYNVALVLEVEKKTAEERIESLASLGRDLVEFIQVLGVHPTVSIEYNKLLDRAEELGLL